jgi:hypothetical protein
MGEIFQPAYAKQVSVSVSAADRVPAHADFHTGSSHAYAPWLPTLQLPLKVRLAVDALAVALPSFTR